MRLRRGLINVCLVLVLAGLLYLAWLTFQWQRFLYRPMLANTQTPIEVEVRQGTGVNSLAWKLKRQGLLQHPDYFILLARMRGAFTRIQAGTYLIQPGKTTPAKFLDDMLAGRVILRELTIVEGWTFAQMMQAINSNPYLTHTLAGKDPQAIMTALGYPEQNYEGHFYPDTYLFGDGTSDVKILKKAYLKMNNLLAQAWAKRATGLPYDSPEQALIAASLIERETAVAAERPLISGVIIRRLQKNMRLQIDPTVIYALGSAYQGKLTTQDLLVNSPYNTYLHKGLPPTAIAFPSTSSVQAALHPTLSDALYYVASGKNGSHIFSATLRQHDAAIDKYLLSPKFSLAPWLLLNNLKLLNQNYCTLN